MSISLKAIELENRSIGINGEPTLAEAYTILKKQWDNGDRDREIGLHLMFLAWYGHIEPPHLTGFSGSENLYQVFADVHDHFEPQIHQDAEMLYAFGLAAHMFWFMFDDINIWEERSKKYHKLYRDLAPEGLNPEIFRDRGAYGDYYLRQAKVEGGY